MRIIIEVRESEDGQGFYPAEVEIGDVYGSDDYPTEKILWRGETLRKTVFINSLAGKQRR